MESESDIGSDFYKTPYAEDKKRTFNSSSFRQLSPLTVLAKGMEEEEESQKEFLGLNSLKDYCEVCYSKTTPAFQDERLAKLFKLIHCKGCGTCAHLICYGLATPLQKGPSDGYDDDGKKYFFCDRCREGCPDKEINCYICNKSKDGCLRLASDKNKWVHTLCAVESSNVSVDDVTTMSIDINNFRKETQKISTKKRCAICTVKVGTLPCTQSGGRYCHLHCAIQDAFQDPEHTYWKTWFSIRDNKRARVGEVIDEKRLSEDAEDMALSLKELIEKVGMKGELGIIMELKSRKSTKNGRTRKRVNKEDPRVSRFFDNVVAEAKYKNKEVFGEGMLDEGADDDTIRHVGGKVAIVYDKKGDAILRMQEQDDEEDEEEFPELGNNASDEENLKETIHSFYREIFNENSLLEVYSDDKLAIFKEELPKFPNLKVLSFPEVVFFAVVFQKRAEAAYRNLIRSNDLEDLIQSARFIPFTLGAQLRMLNQKHLCGIVADVVLEPYINRCAPESAYFPYDMNFNEDMVKRNNSSIKQIAELKDLYLKDFCGVITECYSISVGFQRQLTFLKELYQGIVRYFNHNDYSKKDPYANLNRNSFSRPKLPKIPLPILSIYHAKAKAAGLSPDLAEMELLETMVKQGSQYFSGNPMIQNNQPTLDFFTSKRRMSEDSAGSFDDFASIRSDSRGFEPKEKKAAKPVKEKKTTPNKSGGGRGRGRPRKSETVANEINTEYRMKIRRLGEKPTLQEAQRILDGDAKELFASFNVNEEQLEEGIVKAKEWRRQYEDAIESGEDRRLRRLVEQIDMIDVKIPEMSKLLEMKKEFDLWRNKVEDLHKRLKKKVDDVYTEKDKMVDMNEIREAVEAHKTIIMFEVDDGGKFRDLEKKVETVSKIKENMERGGNSSFGQLKEIEKQLKENNIYIEEIGELKEKQYINEKIEGVLKNPCTVEDIERVLREVKDNIDTIDSDLLVKLRTKEQKAKKLNTEATDVLKNHKTSFSIEEISLMAFTIKEADVKKIRSDKIQALRNTVQDFLLFSNVYSTLFSVEKIDIDMLESHDYAHFTGRDTEKLTKKCVETLRDTFSTLSESKIRVLQEACKDFRQSHRDNSSYMHPFFQQIANIVWKVNDKESSGFEKRRNESVTTKASFKAQTAKSTNSPFKGSDMIEVETYSAVDTEKFLSQYDDETPHKPSIAKGDEGVLLNILEKAEKSTSVDFEDLIEELERLKEKHEKSPSATKFSGLFTDSKKLVDKIKCAIDAVILKKGVDEEGRVIPYNQLERVAQRIEEVGLPSKTGLCRILTTWYSKAQNARKDYYRVYEKKKDKLNIPDIDKIRIEELILKNRVKSSYEEAKEILATLKSVQQFTALKVEIEVIEKDMEVFEDLALKVEGLIKKYSPLFEKYILAKEKYTKHIYEASSEDSAKEVEETKETLKLKRDSIKKDLDQLKRDLAASALRRKSEEMSIRIFSWLCDTVIFISGVGRKAEREIVEKMIKVGKELESEKDTRIEKVIRLLKLQLSTAQSIKEFVEKMRRNEASVTADEVREKKIEFQDCQVLLLTEESFLEAYKTAPLPSRGKQSKSKEILMKDTTNLMKTEEQTPREYRIRGTEDSMDSNRFKENTKEDSLSSLPPGTQIPARILTPAKIFAPAPKDDGENSRGSSLSAELLAGPKVPEGTILRIYEGCIEDVDEKEYQKLGLYTCDSFDIVDKIPQINSAEEGLTARLKITKKVPTDKFEEYLSFTLANRHKKSEKVIAGWIESHISIYQSRSEQIAKDLLANEVVAVCEYNQSSRVFLMHKDQMKDDWKTELNFREKKVNKGSNSSLFFILVHKPYKMKGDAKMIIPETVTASSEKNTPNSHGVDKSHHMFSATTDNTDKVITGKEMEEEDVDNSSIEPSPEKEEEEAQEFGQADTNTNKSLVTESMPAESSGWGENANKNENMERETRLMLGENEWTLNAKLGENSVNGKRGFEYYEQLRAAKKTPAPTKQQREEAEQEDEDEEEEDVEKVEKKVKREDFDYQKLLDSLHDLNQEEIMNIAQGLDNAGREAIIHLLMQAEKDADADEETHTENKRLMSILTPTKDMKEFQSTDPIIVHRTPPKNKNEEAAPAQKDPIIVQKPATPSSMLNVFNTPTTQKPVNFNIQRSPCADIFDMGNAIAAIRERNENSPNRSPGSHRSDGSPAFGGRVSPLGSFGVVTARKNDASLGNLLTAPVVKVPSASKSDSAHYKRSTEDKVGGGSRSVENKTGDANGNQIPLQFPFFQEFLNLASANGIQHINENTFGFAQQQNAMNEEIHEDYNEEKENVAIEEEEAQGFLNGAENGNGNQPIIWDQIVGQLIQRVMPQAAGNLKNNWNVNQYPYNN